MRHASRRIAIALLDRTFFYPNPLESAGQHQRSRWFGVACCPGNMTRFLASVPGYVYARQGDTIYVNLFVAGTAEVDLDGVLLPLVAREGKHGVDLQRRRLRAGDDERAAPRGGPAARLVLGHPGVEGAMRAAEAPHVSGCIPGDPGAERAN
jgi:hypothetical protein